MKKFLMASTALLALPGMAFAADLPAKKEAAPQPQPQAEAAAVIPPKAAPSVSWNGPYIGGQLGFALNTVGLDTTDTTAHVTSNSPSNSINQGLLGARAGYDWQLGKMVLGVVADADWRLGDSNFDTGDGLFAFPTGWKAKSNWDAGLRARAGMLVEDNTLLYLTGGLAVANFDLSNGVCSGCAEWGTENVLGGTKLGWSAGAGGEYRFNSKWSVNVEYLYADYGKTTLNYVNGNAYSSSSAATGSSVKAGVNYRF